jgi:hypothetical protein
VPVSRHESEEVVINLPGDNTNCMNSAVHPEQPSGRENSDMGLRANGEGSVMREARKPDDENMTAM